MTLNISSAVAISSYQPIAFSASISAGLGDSFAVTLQDGRLDYLLWDPSEGQSEIAVGPEAATWRSFRRSLDRIGAWSWSGSYASPPETGRTDGISWKIDIDYADGRAIHCEGYDAYPPRGDTEEPSRPFRAFCRAVSRLLGGLEFGWITAPPSTAKGSRLRVNQWVHEHRAHFERQLCRQVPSLNEFVIEPGNSINWIAPDPLGNEIRDGLWPLALPRPSPQEEGFWPARGPVWDAAGVVGGRERTGIVLIEAKSHPRELLSPRMAPSSYCVDEQRRAALDEAKLAYQVDRSVPWTITYYQLANRLAFLYYLRIRRKEPAWLINVYFYGDRFRSGGGEIIGPEDPAGWQDAIGEAKRALGIDHDHPLREYVADVFLPAEPTEILKEDDSYILRRRASTVLALAGLAAGEAGGGGGRAGEITQLSLATAEGLIRGYVRFRGGKQPVMQDQIRRAYLRWASVQGLPLGVGSAPKTVPLGWLWRQTFMREDRPRGNTSRRALADAPPEQLTADNQSKGSACVPRAAACGLIHPDVFDDDPRDLLARGAESAAVTHGHPVAHAASGAFASILYFICEGATLQGAVLRTQELLHDQDAVTDETAIATVVQHLQTALDRSFGGGVYTHAEQFGWKGYVAEEALALGVWAATQENLTAALSQAGDHGGERHATRAIAGALWGALAGVRHWGRAGDGALSFDDAPQPLDDLPDDPAPPADRARWPGW